MKYKYYSLFIFLICLSWIVIACSNNIDYTYKGRNYIQMSTSDDTAHDVLQLEECRQV